MDTHLLFVLDNLCGAARANFQHWQLAKGYAILTRMAANPSQSLAPALRPSRKPRILLVLLLLLCGLFVYSYIGRQAERTVIEQEIEALRAQLVAGQQEQQRLQDELAYVAGPDYLDKVAREEFDMARPGDRVIIRVEKQPAAFTGSAPVGVQLSEPQASAAPNLRPLPPAEPIWQQWLAFFSSASGSNP
jgi:cell division protein FtsB